MSVNINWLGLSCFKINAKVGDTEVDIVTDPYSPASGLKLPRNLSADIVTVSHDHANHNYVEGVGGNHFVMKSPGEVEEKGVFIYGIHSKAHDGKTNNTLFRLEVGDISIAHLGDIAHEFTDEELEQLEDVDILLVPAGGENGATVKQAVNLVNQLQPRIVIPMHYKLPELKSDLLPVDKFLKEIGAKSETMPKLKIAKKDLPQEETKVIVLERG